jgi:hypothetical protein
MKKLLVVSFMIFVQNGYAQNPYKWRSGSAKTLQGKIYVLTIFISETTKWDKKERQEMVNNLYQAQNWLKAQALDNYEKKISFENGSFGFDKPIIAENIVAGSGSGKEPTDLIGKYLKKVGYNTPQDFGNWVKQNTSCQNYYVILMTNKNGRCYAMPYSEGLDKIYFVEGCMIYSNYEDGRKTATASIAHETLHLFGAPDLYHTFQQPQDREDKARKIYPDDIMLRVSFDIKDLKIDKCSAWYVGINHKKEDGFLWFNPK